MLLCQKDTRLNFFIQFVEEIGKGMILSRNLLVYQNSHKKGSQDSYPYQGPFYIRISQSKPEQIITGNITII